MDIKEALVKILEHAEDLMESTQIQKFIASSVMLHGLAIRMVAGTDSREELEAECKELLSHKHVDGLTPGIMADRMRRIAALPKPVLLNDEGRVYCVRIDDPEGDGSVWCALDISERARKGLEEARTKAKAARHG